ncbi:MAG: hypothetical protein ACRETZ_07345 [Steroidobacteraceae bacterium]
MKALRCLMPALILSCSPLAFAHAPAQSPAQIPAQKSFDLMKSLAGTWEGAVTTFPAQKSMQGARVEVRLRVTSSGNAIMHELTSRGSPDDPITMLYLNGGRLYLRHYCDAGNRPRMVAKISPGGKTINFNLVDVSGSERYGYMEHAEFTMIDARHHTEDWTYLEPGNHPVRAHLDLHRVDGATAAR